MSAWLRRHLNALGDALGRLAAQPLAAGMSILVLAVAIALPVIAAIALRSVSVAASSFDTDPQVNVFLALDADDADVRRIEQALKSDGGVAGVRFVSRAQAFEELKATTHLAEILATLDRNPLPHAFTVRLRPEGVERIGALREAWARLPKVDQVVADFEWAQRLGRWVRFADRMLLALGVVLAAAVMFIVGHLIRLQVLTRRAEIEVSQLIGATAADVRRPLLYHGALQGLLSGALAVGIAGALAAWGAYEMRALALNYTFELKVVFPGLNMIVAVVLGAGALGLAGAWTAVSRELRRFSAV
jgi:cell division transport system permease protein